MHGNLLSGGLGQNAKTHSTEQHNVCSCRSDGKDTSFLAEWKERGIQLKFIILSSAVEGHIPRRSRTVLLKSQLPRLVDDFDS